ncbi:hypothetical protein ACFS5L_33265 [Streptomyces phyllanthi]|uniref:CTP synthase (glutamine hydrolyzing) n=1 Tax=Streptomyces phyllanthi TaxID=1803180 RepID=A0A5N8WAY9_9ACTN|nr:hypothetical protein [Streptomyces phyllanthi]MPY44292.1 hypothetical protein [Streptomyces phyllanthi]
MTGIERTRPRVALVGNRNDHSPAHPRLEAFGPHLAVELEWVASQNVTGVADLAGYDGIWVIPGSPYVSRDGVLTAIRHARETGVPYLGTSGGFQQALVEYMRNVLGVAGADDVRYDPGTATPVIIPLVCCLTGRQVSLHLGDGTRLSGVYSGAEQITETFHCRYGLNPDFADTIERSDLVISGWDSEGAARAVELADHPFFIGTLFQPELSSEPRAVHPLIEAYTRAVLRHAGVEPYEPARLS